jgi:hypothetical protein
MDQRKRHDENWSNRLLRDMKGGHNEGRARRLDEIDP